MDRPYDSEAAIEQVVRGFETCTTPKTDFHHREHLTVAVWYLQFLSREQVVERVRSGLLRFLDHHGINPEKYSEEVTVSWVTAIANSLEEMEANLSLLEQCNRVVERFSSPAHTPAVRVAGEASLAKS